VRGKEEKKFLNEQITKNLNLKRTIYPEPKDTDTHTHKHVDTYHKRTGRQREEHITGTMSGGGFSHYSVWGVVSLSNS
jgi:hypothetical protein